jgi:hypothetical protein
MGWTRFGLGLLLLVWLGGCAGRSGGPGFGDTFNVGQRQEELVARQGQPQEVQPGPGGGKIYIYTTYSLDQVAAMGGGAWNRPDQVYYWLDDQGVITKVARYPYGKRNFLFPAADRPTPAAQAPVAPAPAPVAAASPARPADATPAAEKISQPQPQAQPEPQPKLQPQMAVSVPQAAKPPSPEVVSAPAAAPGPSIRSDMDAASRLELNMSREEVRRLLGAPERTEGFRAAGRGLIVWYYLLESRQGRRLLTPLVFEEGRLSGWGEEYYKRRLRGLPGATP